MQLAYVLLIMFIAHMHSAHILHKAWHYSVQLYANCLYAPYLRFVYAFIARVHGAHIFLHTKHGMHLAHMQYAHKQHVCNK